MLTNSPNINAAPGVFYVVATPIGNLADLSERALRILKSVDYIAAEDTRHSAGLLQYFGISTPMISCHDHNERQRISKFLSDLRQGKSIALISDAGTPLLSDPGFPIVRALREAGLRVLPVPGPSSITAALSVAGLPTDRFAFEGFLPAKVMARQARLQALRTSTYTLVFLESSHRIQPALQDMQAILGAQRPACVARELTKRYEEIFTAPLQEINGWLSERPERRKGEFVILVAAAEPDSDPVPPDTRRILKILLAELPLKRAVAITNELSGAPKNALYNLALAWQDDQSSR